MESRKANKIFGLFLLFLCVAGGTLWILNYSSVRSATYIYNEQFDTTTYRDTNNTTADWNIGQGLVLLQYHDDYWVKANGVTQGEDTVMSASGTGEDLILDSSGNPYVMSGSHGDNDVRFSRWNTSPDPGTCAAVAGVCWTNMAGDTEGSEVVAPGNTVRDAQIMRVYNDTPYIVGSEGTQNNPLADALFVRWNSSAGAGVCGGPTACWTNMAGDTAGWEIIEDDVGGAVFPKDLEIDSNGYPHVVSLSTDIMFTRWDGAAWTVPYSVSGNGGTAMLGTDADMDIDFFDDVHIVFTDTSDGDFNVYYRKLEGGFWGGKTKLSNNASFTGDMQTKADPQIIVDSVGDIHVVWASPEDGDYDIYYRKYSAGMWGAAQNISNNGSNSVNPVLRIDETDKPHIAWSDNNQGNYNIHYTKWNGSQWIDRSGNPGSGLVWNTSTEPSDTSTEAYPIMEIDSNHRAHIMWNDDTDGDGLYNVYYTRDGGSWWQRADGAILYDNVTEGTSDPKGLVRDLALDSNNRANIIWRQFGGGNIMFTKYDGSTGYYDSSNTFQSVEVDSTTDTIIEATLTTIEDGIGGITSSAYYLSNNGGDDWAEVDTGVAHQFTTPGSDLRWKQVFTTNDTSITPYIEELQVDYEDTTNSFTLTAPNGGESWAAGSSQTITWSTSGTVANVKIEYSLNNGLSWDTIIPSTANTGSYPWTVPYVHSQNALVRVSDVIYPAVQDQSNAIFTIANNQPSAPTVTAPTNFATGVSLTPTFTFSATDPDGDDLTYEIQITNTYTFNNVHSSYLQQDDPRGWSQSNYYSSGATASFTLPDYIYELSSGSVYRWRVRAIDKLHSSSAWSSAYTFITTEGPPFKTRFDSWSKYDYARTGLLYNRHAKGLKLPATNTFNSAVNLGGVNSDVTYHMAAFDADNDGDIDLALANGTDNDFCENDGTGTYSCSSNFHPGGMGVSDLIRAADFDNDGDIDVLADGINLMLYLNDGSGNFTESNTGIDTGDFVIGDVDADLDIDIIRLMNDASPTEENELYLNDGDGTFTQITGSASPFDGVDDYSYGGVVADFNGDRFNDIVISNYIGGGILTQLYLYNGDGTWTASDIMNDNVSPTRDIFAVDTDGDGDLDIITPGSDGNWLNDGNGNFSAAYNDLDNSDNSVIHYGDVDGDGDVDVISGENTSTTHLYRSSGSSRFSDEDGVFGAVTASVMLTVDVDNDGDLDVVVGQAGDQNYLYINNQANYYTETVLASTMVNALFDSDNDGDLDQVTTFSTLRVNDGNQNYSNSSIFTPPSTLSNMKVADVTGDGYQDLIFVFQNFANRLFINGGASSLNTFTESVNAFGTDTEDTLDVGIEDYDDDGDLDVIIVNDESGIEYWLNDGSGSFTADTNSNFSELNGANQGAFNIDSADVDYDGDIDVVFASTASGGGGPFLYLNNGDGNFTRDTGFMTDWSEALTSLQFGNFNSDGFIDLVALKGAVGVPDTAQTYIYLNDGHGYFQRSVKLPAGDGVIFAFVEDIDFDGDDDIVASFYQDTLGNPGPSEIYRNMGNLIFSKQQIGGSHGDIRFVIGDYDLDGDMDMFSYSGTPNQYTANQYFDISQTLPYSSIEIDNITDVDDVISSATFSYTGTMPTGASVSAVATSDGLNFSSLTPVTSNDLFSVFDRASPSLQHTFMAGENGTVLYTTDITGGTIYDRTHPTDTSTFYDLYNEENAFFVVGGDGSGTAAGYISMDAGVNYMPLNPGTTEDVYTLIVNERIGGVFGGSNGLLRYTLDNGMTTFPCNVTGGLTEDIYGGHADFFGEYTYAVGANGTILRTDSTTTIANWTVLGNSGTTEDLNDISCFDGVCVAVGNNGTIIQSLDHGATWRTVTVDTTENLLEISPTIYYKLWVVGENGTLLYSADLGFTWVEVETGIPGTYNAVTNTWGDNDTIIVGNDGLMIAQSDHSYESVTFDAKHTFSSGPSLYYVLNGSSSNSNVSPTIRSLSVDYNAQPRTPTNSTPSSGATQLDSKNIINFASSAFSDPDSGSHTASQWQITDTFGDYSSPVYNSGTDVVNLTTLALPANTLGEATTYYWRVRYQDDDSDWSPYSTETGFTTKAGGSPPYTSHINPPSLSKVTPDTNSIEFCIIDNSTNETAFVMYNNSTHQEVARVNSPNMQGSGEEVCLTVSGLIANKEYSNLTVIATNGNMDSMQLAFDPVTTLARAPIINSGSQNNNQINVNWDYNNNSTSTRFAMSVVYDETEYWVGSDGTLINEPYYDSYFNWTGIVQVVEFDQLGGFSGPIDPTSGLNSGVGDFTGGVGNITPFTGGRSINDLTIGKTYHIRVIARNDDLINSSFSNTLTITLGAAAPSITVTKDSAIVVTQEFTLADVAFAANPENLIQWFRDAEFVVDYVKYALLLLLFVVIILLFKNGSKRVKILLTSIPEIIWGKHDRSHRVKIFKLLNEEDKLSSAKRYSRHEKYHRFSIAIFVSFMITAVFKVILAGLLVLLLVNMGSHKQVIAYDGPVNPGDEMMYFIEINNEGGTAPATNIELIDLLLPSNVSYIANSLTFNNQPQTDLIDDDYGRYYDDGPGTNGVVKVEMAELPAGEKANISFRVVVTAESGAQISNQTRFYSNEYVDGLYSNEVRNQVTDQNIFFQCNDSIDNDGDGLIDYPADPGCESAFDNSESDEPLPEGCGDGECSQGENCLNCELDCGECQPLENYCGDNYCDGELGETCVNCEDDCGICPLDYEYCGDLICQDNEDCLNCRADCGSCEDIIDGAICGDGLKASTEECDDGNNMNGDGCSATCTIEVNFCGDGMCVEQIGESCANCPFDCGECEPIENYCGNNYCDILVGETCEICEDDCGICPTGPYCGDGLCNLLTECPNCVADCDSSCEFEPVPLCGDGILQEVLLGGGSSRFNERGGEECDDGNTEDGDGCSSDCLIEGDGPVCGNDIWEVDEECDDGNNQSGDGCSESCLIEAEESECGNDVLEEGEECDDGNTEDGDGCSSECVIEIELCGNGELDEEEECDDGNEMPGDGCSLDCTIEETREIMLKAYPEKRIPAEGNWSTTGLLNLFNAETGDFMYGFLVDLDDQGQALISDKNIADGVYDVSFKGRSHLAKRLMSFEVVSDDDISIDFTVNNQFLLAGDVQANKDNYINGLDFSAIGSVLYGSNLNADLNRDGVVNSLDLSIAANNIYKRGE